MPHGRTYSNSHLSPRVPESPRCPRMQRSPSRGRRINSLPLKSIISRFPFAPDIKCLAVRCFPLLSPCALFQKRRVEVLPTSFSKSQTFSSIFAQKRNPCLPHLFPEIISTTSFRGFVRISRCPLGAHVGSAAGFDTGSRGDEANPYHKVSLGMQSFGGLACCTPVQKSSADRAALAIH